MEIHAFRYTYRTYTIEVMPSVIENGQNRIIYKPMTARCVVGNPRITKNNNREDGEYSKNTHEKIYNAIRGGVYN